MTLIHQIFILVLFFLMVPGCGNQQQDTRAIYKVIFAKVEFPGKVIHLKSSVVRPDLKITLKEDLEYFQKFKITDNTTTFTQAHFEKLNVVLIDEEKIKSIFKQSCEQDWKTFHKMYPEAGTLFAVSNVGFADNRKRAIVYLEGMSGCQDSEGVLFSLEKTDGEWKILDFINL